MLHVPIDFGLILYYIPDLRTPSDYSDDDARLDEMRSLARMGRRAGGVLDGLPDDGFGADDRDKHADGENQEDEIDEIHAEYLEEVLEKELATDLAEMKVNSHYGKWGCGNALQKEI